MKKLFNGLEVTEKDNFFTAFAKGGAKGYLKCSATILPILGTIMIIGKCLLKEEELAKFEEKMGE